MKPEVYVDNIQDKRLRVIVKEMPNVCHCFDRDSVRAGHVVNPPCATIIAAQRIRDMLAIWDNTVHDTLKDKND